jgi:hypothetical protein
MFTKSTTRILVMGLVLATGTAQAGWFSKKKAPPPPPPPPPVVVPVEPPPPPPPIPLLFSGVQTQAPQPAPLDLIKAASPEVQAVQQWVAATKDNAKLPFIVVDKVNARVYSFTPFGQLKATAPVLLGMGVGDKAIVSQDAPMSAMTPDKRITPAGRYLSRLVMDPHTKHPVLLIDGQNLITLHIVAKGTPAQRRAERLASLGSDDNRISFGCINVPPAFFETVVDPDFRPAKGIVYILPEKTTAAQLFGFQPATNGPLALQAALQASEMPAAIQPSQTAPATLGTFAAPSAPVTLGTFAPPSAPVTAVDATVASAAATAGNAPVASAPATAGNAPVASVPSSAPVNLGSAAAPSAPASLGDTTAPAAPDTR